MVEPWLRGTLPDLDALRRQVLHALELTHEDAIRWCAELSEEELHASPFGLPSVAFQMLHIVRSLDRLLTYAEDRPLTQGQLNALGSERQSSSAEHLFAEFHVCLAQGAQRVRDFHPDEYELTRHVGRDRLSTTLGGLLIHCAEHTQRHTGQMITTAKLVLALRSGNKS